MGIENIIVHHLAKKRHEDSIIRYREDELQVTSAVTTLFDDIANLYERKTGKAYGIFEDDELNYPFSKLTGDHYDAEDSNFIDYTKTAMTILKAKIDSENLATGGYVLFINYTDNSKNFLLIVMLNDTKGHVVTRNLEIRESQHLDMSRLHLGGRVCISDWRDEDDDGKYISFIKGRAGGDGISNYFREFLGCDEYIDSKVETSNMVSILSTYCKERNLSDEETLRVKQDVHAHCKRRAQEGRTVSLEQLSHVVNPDLPEDFMTFANSEEHKLNDGFDPHTRVLRNLIRYSGKGKGITISFNSDLFGETIKYNAEQDILTIHGIPEDLKKELMQ